MDPLVVVHVVAGSVLVALALVVGAWGIARARHIGSGRSVREGRAFGQLLQFTHTLIVATCGLGLVLLAQDDHHATDPLHVRVYGPFMLVAVVAAYGYRTRDSVLNVRIFAVASLVVFALGLRALWTGG